MKKFLSRIFSVALVAATVASPSMAQLAKKAGGVKATTPKVSVATVAKEAPAKKSQVKGSMLDQVQVRSMAAKSSKGIKSAQSSAVAFKNTVVKAPAKEAGNLPQLNGMIIYNEEFGAEDTGLYELPLNANDVATPIVTGFTGYGAVLKDGIYYVTGYESFWGFILSIDLYEVDVEAEEVAHYVFETLEVVNVAMAMDPTTGTVYGVGYTSDGSGLNFQKVNLNGANTTVDVIAACDRNWNTLAFDAQGQLWGISYTGSSESGSYVVSSSSLCKIDKATGAVTEVGETGMAPQYLSSGCIDTKTGRFFWNVCTADENSYMCEVDMSTGAASTLYQFALGDEIEGMYVPGPAAEETAPAECENVEYVFNQDNLSGSFNLTAPSKFFNGENGSGDLTIKILANDEEVGSKTAAWGADVEIPVTVSEAGKYTFVVYAENATGKGPKTRFKNVWVGADTPEATSATLVYANGNMEVTWNEVTSSVNGGYVDYDNLTYKVVRADDTVAAEGLTVTTFSEAVAEPENITSYSYTVYAVADGLVSAPAKTNVVVLGSIVPPYTSNFAEDGLDGWTLIDANEDGKTWNIYQGKLRIAYNTNEEMDDWLITPPLKLEAGKAYNLTFASYAQSTNYPERIEVKMGKAATAEAMTTTVIEPTDILTTSAAPVEFNAMLIPDETGIYYVGFHGISDANMYYLYLDNITIESGISALAPGLASDVVVTPDAAGALKANVSFKAPATTMNGQPLSSLTKVEVLLNDEVVKTFDAPAVGAALSYDDVLTAGGDVTYTIIGYNAEGAGLKATASAYVGFNVPLGVEEAVITRTANVGEVTVTWTPVDQDINGLTLPASEISYTVCRYESGWVKVAEGLTATSYTYQPVAAGEQDFVQLAVFPYSSAGAGDGAVTDMIPVGTPYAGLAASFPDGTLGEYIWGLRGISGGTVVLMTDESGIPAQDGDNGMVGIKGQYLDTGADFFSGLVSLENMVNPGLTFYTFDITKIADEGANPDINEITVAIKAANDEDYTVVYGPKTVQEICEGTDGWGKVSICLADYANQTIQFQITGITKQYVYTVLDNIKVGSILGHDLKASKISAPAKVKVGEDYTVDVTVSNEGAQAASAYSVELYADDELVETKECTNLASGDRATASFEFTMSPVAQEAITYYAKVVYADDENVADNQTSSVVVTPILSTLPAATDLTGTAVENGIKLTWNEPNLEGGVAEPITDDFEDAEGVQNEYGDWTFVDVDGAAVGGFQNSSGQTLEIPGITVGETTGSFWTWDNDNISWANNNPTYEAHSGTKYLFALFNYDGSNSDDWAISPELCGDAQTISFYAKSYSSQYPEQIEVYYSTGSKDIEDFVAIEGSKKFPVPQEWTLYSYDLPANAKYFAIRSYGQNAFMLMVDDVTYTPADSVANLEIKGYNVYRDGIKINDSPVEETQYTDTNVEEGKQYTYVVTVVYAERGESALSNECVVIASGVNAIAEGALKVTVNGQNIVILNAAGVNVTVASVNGAVVFNGLGEAKTVVPVTSGVYVVNTDKSVKKVVIK